MKESKISTLKTIESLPERMVFYGEPIVMGFAVGRVFYYQDIFTHEIEKRELTEGQLEEEIERLQRAIDQVHGDLDNLKSKVTSEIDSEHAEIFRAHQLILKDIELFTKASTSSRDRARSSLRVWLEAYSIRKRRVSARRLGIRSSV